MSHDSVLAFALPAQCTCSARTVRALCGCCTAARARQAHPAPTYTHAVVRSHTRTHTEAGCSAAFVSAEAVPCRSGALCSAEAVLLKKWFSADVVFEYAIRLLS